MVRLDSALLHNKFLCSATKKKGDIFMLHIDTEKDITLDKDYLIVDSKRESMIIRLDLIDHIKHEKKDDVVSKHKANDDMIVLYNENHSVLHRLVFADRKLSEQIYYAIYEVIRERGRTYHAQGVKE